jgi:hypothetical protein
VPCSFHGGKGKVIGVLDHVPVVISATESMVSNQLATESTVSNQLVGDGGVENQTHWREDPPPPPLISLSEPLVITASNVVMKTRALSAHVLKRHQQAPPSYLECRKTGSQPIKRRTKAATYPPT